MSGLFLKATVYAAEFSVRIAVTLAPTCEIYGSSICLLQSIAAEETEQLDGDAFESIRPCVALPCIEY